MSPPTGRRSIVNRARRGRRARVGYSRPASPRRAAAE